MRTRIMRNLSKRNSRLTSRLALMVCSILLMSLVFAVSIVWLILATPRGVERKSTDTAPQTLQVFPSVSPSHSTSILEPVAVQTWVGASLGRRETAYFGPPTGNSEWGALNHSGGYPAVIYRDVRNPDILCLQLLNIPSTTGLGPKKPDSVVVMEGA